MLVKQCHKPPMIGNDNHTTYKNGDDWGMVYYCFTHIIHHWIALREILQARPIFDGENHEFP